MEYWKESISSAAEDCGLVMTDEQLDFMADAMKGSYECYGLYNGYDSITCPAESATKRELEELKRKIEIEENWKNSTEPCKKCNTTGTIMDGWGRDIDCSNCNGKGRIKREWR